MKTKNKIIDAAIRLYNEQGFANVTSRHIASSIEISHGNLEYHFPNKEVLLLAIYDQMREDMSRFYQGRQDDMLNPMEHFHRLLIRLEKFQEEYKFFNLDVLEIFRKYEKVNKLLQDTLQIRQVQMRNIFQKLEEEAYLKPEPSDNFYQRLQHTIRILITFWKPQEVILSNFNFQQRGEMTKHIWEILFPHLSDKGILEYNNYAYQKPKP